MEPQKYDELLKALEGENEALLRVLKKFNDDIFQLKKDNLIMKQILKGVLNIPDSIYNV